MNTVFGRSHAENDYDSRINGVAERLRELEEALEGELREDRNWAVLLVFLSIAFAQIIGVGLLVWALLG